MKEKISFLLLFLSGFFISWGEGMQHFFSHATVMYPLAVGLLMILYADDLFGKKSVYAIPPQYKYLLLFVYLHTFIFVIFHPSVLSFGKTEGLVTESDFTFYDSATGDTIVRYFLFSFASILLSYLFRKEKYLNIFLWSYSLGFAATILLGGYVGDYSDYFRLSGGMKDPNVMAMDAVVVFWASLYLLKQQDKRLNSCILYVIIIISLYALGMSFSRGALMAFVFSLMAWFWINGFKRVIKYLILGFVVLIVIFSFIPNEIKDIFTLRFSLEETLDDKGAGRLDIWKEYLSYWLDYFITGTGLTNGQSVMALHHSSEFRVTHNQYLEYFVEFGIIGFILYISYLYSAFKVCVKSRISLSMVFVAICIFTFFINIDRGRTFWAVTAIVNYIWYKQTRMKSNLCKS